jgi:hypothetical protein
MTREPETHDALHLPGSCSWHRGREVGLVYGQDWRSVVSVAEAAVRLVDGKEEVALCEKAGLAAAGHHDVKVLQSTLLSLSRERLQCRENHSPGAPAGKASAACPWLARACRCCWHAAVYTAPFGHCAWRCRLIAWCGENVYASEGIPVQGSFARYHVVQCVKCSGPHTARHCNMFEAAPCTTAAPQTAAVVSKHSCAASRIQAADRTRSHLVLRSDPSQPSTRKFITTLV